MGVFCRSFWFVCLIISSEGCLSYNNTLVFRPGSGCGMGKRRKGLNVNEDINEEGKSSYAELKKKLVKTKEECRILRLTLQDTQTKQSDLVLEVELLRTQSREDKCQRLRLELDDTIRQKKRVEAQLMEMRLAWQDMHVKQSDLVLQVQQLQLQLQDAM
jgi:hypothetical protein